MMNRVEGLVQTSYVHWKRERWRYPMLYDNFPMSDHCINLSFTLQALQACQVTRLASKLSAFRFSMIKGKYICPLITFI